MLVVLLVEILEVLMLRAGALVQQRIAGKQLLAENWVAEVFENQHWAREKLGAVLTEMQTMPGSVIVRLELELVHCLAGRH